MRTHVPGYAGEKLVLLTVSLLILGLGVYTLTEPVRLLFSGERGYAVVAQIVKTKPGYPDEDFTVKQAIADEPSREARFWYYARLPESERIVRLNIAHQIRPRYNVGDRVAVLFDQKLAAAYDVSKPRSIGAYVVFQKAPPQPARGEDGGPPRWSAHLICAFDRVMWGIECLGTPAWLLGAILTGAGLFWSFITGRMLINARRPIEMPPDTPGG